MHFILLDVRPDPVGPVGVGILAVVLLMVIALVILVTAGLVFVFWYRKRQMRTVEMIRSDTASILAAAPAQPNNPNQR
jgi:hypothetical protein